MRIYSVARWGVVSLIAIAPAIHAQSLASRVSAVGNGAVNFHFAARAGVCGDGRNFMRIGHSFHGNWSSDFRSAPCDAGPVQVRLTVHDGDVERVETWAGTMRAREGKDLGEVSSRESAQYLLGIAARANSGASSKAILPAVLADSATVWPTLLVIARDSATRSHATRQDAAFWLSRFAASALAGKGHDLLDDDDTDDESDKESLKKHAVFVLSQLPHHEGVPALLDVARSNADRKVRGQALFWLGQSGDARALALFESLLRG
jgi:hypothetical protein